MGRRNFSFILRFDNDNFTKSGCFIRLNLISNVFNNALEFDLTSSLRYDNSVERVPLRNQLTFFYYFTIGYIKCRTVRNVVCRKYNTRIDVDETNFSQTAYYHFGSFTCFVDNIYRTKFFEFQTSIVLGNDTCISCDIGSRTTGMECTQCQLCTRFTNRLGSNYTDSLTFLNHMVRSQITAVTFRANSLLRFASQYRTDFNTFDRRLLYLLSDIFCNFFTTSNQQFSGLGMYDIMYGYTTKDAFVQGSDNFIVVLKVCTNQSAERTAILFINNNIMRNIYQTTSQISGIGSLQCGIGQTFTGTVGRDKILQYGKSFFKVRQNRVFDDLATFGTCFLRLSHQTTHTGKLTNLLFRTTGTGIKHHVHRIETLIIRRNCLHQNVRQLRVNMCPDINHLIVTFVIGNETHVIVIDHLLNFIVTSLNKCLFLFWNDNITQVE